MPLEKPFRSRVIIAALLAAVWACPGAVRAAAPGYEVQGGVAESDNIQRVPSGGRSDTIGFEELGFTWHDKRPRLDLDVDSDISHLNYFRNTYGDEFIGNFIGRANLKLAPHWLSWNFSDNFGQSRVNLLAPITPGNRENINYFNTGPVLSLPAGRNTRLDVTGQYGRVDYQKSPLDSNHLTGGASLLHFLSPLSSISLNAKDERIEFANDRLNPNFDLQEAFGRFQASGSRTQIAIDLGYGRLHTAALNDGSPLVRLDLSRRTSASSSIGLGIGRAYSEGADSFRLVQGLDGATLNTQSTVQSSAPFIGDYGTLAWNFQRVRSTVNLSASYFRDRYKSSSALDNDRVMIDARAGRQISRSVQLALTEDLRRQRYVNAGGSTTETDTGLQLSWRAGRRLSVFLAYDLAKGRSNIPGNEYTENRVLLSVGYGRAAEIPPGPAPLRLPGGANFRAL